MKIIITINLIIKKSFLLHPKKCKKKIRNNWIEKMNYYNFNNKKVIFTTSEKCKQNKKKIITICLIIKKSYLLHQNKYYNVLEYNTSIFYSNQIDI